jgi:hypothetical protein
MNVRCKCQKSILEFTYEIVRVGAAGEYFGKCCLVEQLPKKEQEPVEGTQDIAHSVSDNKPSQGVTKTPVSLPSIEKWLIESGLKPREKDLYRVSGNRAYLNFVKWFQKNHFFDEVPPTLNTFGKAMQGVCQKKRFGSGMFYFLGRPL